jgi:hypothetical protein
MPVAVVNRTEEGDRSARGPVLNIMVTTTRFDELGTGRAPEAGAGRGSDDH